MNCVPPLVLRFVTPPENRPIRRADSGVNFELLNRILGWNQDRHVDVGDVERLSVEILDTLVANAPLTW